MLYGIGCFLSLLSLTQLFKVERLITLAIHTFDKAVALRSLLENEGITVELHNVNLEVPGLSSGVRVRIPEKDLALALRIVENPELFAAPDSNSGHIVMVPVDFSEHSYKAVEVGAALAARSNARLHFVYSYIDPYITGTLQFKDSLSYDDSEPRARAMLEADGQKLMANFCERVRNAMKQGHMLPVPFTSKVTEGVPEDAIVEHGKQIKPSIIVMGTRGAARKEAEMIGSITAEVLDEGLFTVLSVPETASTSDVLTPHNILFFSNLDQEDILAMDAVYRIFGGTGVKVTIMHVPQRRRFSDSGAGKALHKLSQYCADNFANYHFISVPVNPSDCEEAFASLQQGQSFDLIVAPNRRRNALSRLFYPGLAHKIIFQTDVPMLVIPV